jgi:predicted metal-dependent hydrolase
MPTTIDLGGTTLHVVRKDIKNVHLSVYPPAGVVRVAAPTRMSLDTIRLFTLSKLPWIRQQQKKLRAQARETPREYLDRESHHVWGRRVLLKVVERDAAPQVELRPTKLVLLVRPGTEEAARDAIIAAWYRQILREAVQPLLDTWERRLNVTTAGFYVQHMKTKWGSCNARARTIRLNTELAKKPRECLEYLVVHELAHLRERSHGPRFVTIMDRMLPNWRETRELLNRLPARHERWVY